MTKNLGGRAQMARLKQKKNTAEFRGMSDGIVLFFSSADRHIR